MVLNSESNGYLKDTPEGYPGKVCKEFLGQVEFKITERVVSMKTNLKLSLSYFYHTLLHFSVSMLLRVYYYTCLTCSNICFSIDYRVLSLMCKFTLFSFTKTVVNVSLFLKKTLYYVINRMLPIINKVQIIIIIINK